MDIDHFLSNQPATWMSAEGKDSDIVISTRIRLARNLEHYRFPLSFSEDEAKLVENIMIQTLMSPNAIVQFSYFEMRDLSVLQRQILVEKHLISPNLANKQKTGSVFLAHDEVLSVMVNEEDHIRIQSLASGLQLQEAYENAKQLDEWIGRQVTYAYDERFGYLTTCPTNVGTGLRASVMVHLPALTMSKQMPKLIQMMTRLGMVVRGIYGEGSENLGNIYQISNQVTLGKSDEMILNDLSQLVEQIILKERLTRQRLLKNTPVSLEDRLSRSYGVLLHARILSSEEAAMCLSNVRLGVDLQLLPSISSSLLNECLLFMQPGFIQRYAGEVLQPAERDIYRAKYLQQQLMTTHNERNLKDKGEESHDV